MFKKLKAKAAADEAAMRAANPPAVHISGGLRTAGGSAVQPPGSQFLHMNTDQFRLHMMYDSDA